MKRPSRWRRRLGALSLLALAAVAVAGLAALVIRFAPPWLVSTSGLTGSARLQELSRVRIALLVLVLGALAAAVATYLVRSAARERRREVRERRLIERFMRAVDQIGHRALDVRLGGMYSLERLARESPEHHGPITEILAAFVREHAPWPARSGESRRRPPTDVQAAVTILGRRIVAQDTGASISLMHTALAGATLTGAHFERALLSGANLEGADLFKANLNAADLEGANLRNAGLLLANLNDTVLWGANLEGARLYGANLEGAALKSANLKGAGLTGANLKDAGLHSADLSGADLTGANLEGTGLEGAILERANLQGANLRGAVMLNAVYDGATIWPNGFNPAAQGLVRRTWPQEPPVLASGAGAAAWAEPASSPPEPEPEPEPESEPEPAADPTSWTQPAPSEPEPPAPAHEPAPPSPTGWPHEAGEAPAPSREWSPAPAGGRPHERPGTIHAYSRLTAGPGQAAPAHGVPSFPGRESRSETAAQSAEAEVTPPPPPAWTGNGEERSHTT
jgi:uncharacterized protein YjbI with pentapeptide repeats